MRRVGNGNNMALSATGTSLQPKHTRNQYILLINRDFPSVHTCILKKHKCQGQFCHPGASLYISRPFRVGVHVGRKLPNGVGLMLDPFQMKGGGEEQINHVVVEAYAYGEQSVCFMVGH